MEAVSKHRRMRSAEDLNKVGLHNIAMVNIMAYSLHHNRAGYEMLEEESSTL